MDGEKQEAHHVKLLLEFLVSVVDTELLKTVNLKGFKPEKHFYLIISCITFINYCQHHQS